MECLSAYETNIDYERVYRFKVTNFQVFIARVP